MTYDLETQAKVQEWRRRAIAGTISKEEMIEVVKYLNEGRASASMASTTAKTKRAATRAVANLDGDALLDEMLGGS